MSSSIIWAIPNEVIENAVQNQLNLDGGVTVWGAVFDEVGESVGIIIEVDDDDLTKLGVDDMDCYALEDGELLQ